MDHTETCESTGCKMRYRGQPTNKCPHHLRVTNLNVHTSPPIIRRLNGGYATGDARHRRLVVLKRVQCRNWNQFVKRFHLYLQTKQYQVLTLTRLDSHPLLRSLLPSRFDARVLNVSYGTSCRINTRLCDLMPL